MRKQSIQDTKETDKMYMVHPILGLRPPKGSHHVTSIFIKKFTSGNINVAIILAIKVADSLTESTLKIPQKSIGIESR